MESAASSSPSGTITFIRARLASALAIAPLGVWVFLHVWDNLAVFKGGEAWQEAVTGHKHPASLWVSSLIVLLPLALHTVWGLQRMRTARPNNGRYGFFENLKYLLQRASAAGVLLFVGAHLTLAFLKPRLTTGKAEPFADIAHEMHHEPATLAVYLLGTLGVAYHLGNGLYGFAMGWGLTASRASLKKLGGFSIALFVVLLAMSWAAIYGLYKAGA